jgi:hypothetical protein
MFFGHDVAEALEWVESFEYVHDALARLGPAAREHALDRLRETLLAHHDADRGVLFDSRAWMVTARSS